MHYGFWYLAFRSSCVLQIAPALFRAALCLSHLVCFPNPEDTHCFFVCLFGWFHVYWSVYLANLNSSDQLQVNFLLFQTWKLRSFVKRHFLSFCQGNITWLNWLNATFPGHCHVSLKLRPLVSSKLCVCCSALRSGLSWILLSSQPWRCPLGEKWQATTHTYSWMWRHQVPCANS